MDTTLPFPDCDLREHPPRQARARIGGLYFLARTIDKMRAKIQDTLGPYKIGPGISVYLFEWLGISEAEFEDVVRSAKSDEEIVAWLHAHSDPTKYDDINNRLESRGIRDDAHFAEVLPRYPVLHEYPQLRNWFEILDLDDRWMFDPKNRNALTSS
ncbi:MAG: DUF5069 domain-containing protein [Candidatus Velthaea sp.]